MDKYYTSVHPLPNTNLIYIYKVYVVICKLCCIVLCFIIMYFVLCCVGNKLYLILSYLILSYLSSQIMYPKRLVCVQNKLNLRRKTMLSLHVAASNI